MDTDADNSMKQTKTDKHPSPLREGVDSTGSFLVETFHLLGLFAIGAATVWAATFAFIGMVENGSISVEDLLLLFIYLEIGAMVGIYFKTNHMPVRFVIYVAITAITRHLVGYSNTHTKIELDLLIAAGSILTLSIAILILRYASYHYPSVAGQNNSGNEKPKDQKD